MKILQVHNEYDHKGGEEVVVKLESELLGRQNITVKQFLCSNVGMSMKDKLSAAYSYAGGSSNVGDSLLEVIDDFQPDVVHIHNVFPRIGYSILKKIKARGPLIVLTLHNYRYVCANGLFLRDAIVCDSCKIDRSVVRPIINKCYRDSYLYSAILSLGNWNSVRGNYFDYVDKFIVMTEFAKSILADTGVELSKIIVKPHSSDVLNIKPSGLGFKEYDLVFVGRLSKEKGFFEFIDALSKVHYNLRVAVVGDGQSRQEIQKECEKLDRVDFDFLGWKKPGEVKQIVRSAKALVFPSVWYETFGLVVIEALLEGVPVIARDIGGVPEVVGECSRFLFKNQVEFTESINKVLQLSTDDYYQLSQILQKNSSASYNHERNIQTLVSIYNT